VTKAARLVAQRREARDRAERDRRGARREMRALLLFL
jgi:hypothetical protein